MSPAVTLLDERSDRSPRAVIGELLERSRTADLALGRVRIASLDLSDDEVRGPELCRVLLGRLDASTLLDAATGQGDAGSRSLAPGVPRTSLVRLAGWLESDRLEVRSAGIGSWTPDFSIYRDPAGGATCLLGAHYFGNPQLTVGPSVTVIIEDAAAARVLTGRFQELWSRAHDVAPAILDVLRPAVGRDPDSHASAST